MKFTLVPIFEEHGFSVFVPEGFEVEEKELPPELEERYKDITWFGNFGLRAPNGRTPRKLWFKYEIRVNKYHPKRGEVNELVFWNGEFVVPLTEEFHDLREMTEGDETYFRAKLSLTDPPCGFR
jgi:hypothetical protein